MIRGTTPTHTFRLPIAVSEIAAAEIIYAQKGEHILTKKLTDCTAEGHTMSVKLTQEETLRFDASHPALVQLRVLNNQGVAMATRIRKIAVERLLSDEVLE